MTDLVTIEAEARAQAGKGAARATRRAGRVPAVIYGAKEAPTLISLEPRAVLRELHRGGWRSRLYQVTVGGHTTRALMREIQFHPVTDVPEHVDFQRLALGEKIRVAVPVHFLNEAVCPGLKKGGILNIVRHSVDVFADPDHVPAAFEVDLSTLEIAHNVRWHDLTGTEGFKPATAEKDFVVATIAPPVKAPEAPADAAATAAAPAKGAKPAAKPAAPKKK